MKPRLLALLVATLSGAATAAPVAITVEGANGRPLQGAVVMVDSPKHAAGPIRFPWPYVVEQKDIAFQPHVLIVPVGAAVTFPNRDRVRHHVYSFSPAKKFELKLYGREEARSVTFDKPGIVALGCNIHDAMNGYVVVVDTPYAAQTDAAGRAMLADVPAGGATLRVWHPTVRAPGNQLVTPVAVPAGGLAKTIALGRP